MIRRAIAAIRHLIHPTVPDHSNDALARWVALDGRVTDRPGVVVTEGQGEGQDATTAPVLLRCPDPKCWCNR